MNIKKTVIVVLAFCSSVLQAAIDWHAVSPPLSFQDAKTILLALVHLHPETFYCQCHLEESGAIDCSNSSLNIEGLDEDLLTLEWEHIVPASQLGRPLDCWSGAACPFPTMRPGRHCCQKTSLQFQLREANLYNLVPSIKYANRKRSNFKPGVIEDKQKSMRLCRMWIDKNKRVFEPDDVLKGFIARTYLHMYQLYRFELSHHDQRLYLEWAENFPPDAWELERENILNQIYSFE